MFNYHRKTGQREISSKIIDNQLFPIYKLEMVKIFQR